MPGPRSPRRSFRLAPALALLALACASVETATPGRLGLPASLLSAAGPPTAAQRVLLVTVAGLTPEAYLPGAAGGEVPMPNLAALARAGVAAEQVLPVAPPTAYPAHTSLVSGRRPREHGVTADRKLGKGGVRRALQSHASAVQGPTLWQVAAAEQVPVAALDWPATVGAEIPFLLPDLRPTRRGETWLGLQGQAATPWLREMVERASPDARRGLGPDFDAMLVDLACAILASPSPPRLLLLRLSQTELALRRSGLHAQATRAAFLQADAEIARLARCLEPVARLRETAFVVAGDGASVPVHTLVHVNSALREAGLLGAGRGWSALARSNGGSAFVYARNAEAAVAARRALDREVERTRAFRVVPADEMIERGADPEAWFGLEAEPGFAFADAPSEPRLQPAPQRAASGYLTAEATPGFVAAGAGLRRGLRIPRMQQTDVAPTIARLLGLELRGTEGRALVGALQEPAPVSAGSAEP